MSLSTLSIDESLDAYLLSQTVEEPALLAELREQTLKVTPNPEMQIGPHQGRLLVWLARLIGAKRVLEIGTFTGYSSLCFAEAVPDAPDGAVVCCDISEEFTAIARTFWDKAGVADKITLHLGPASDSLAAMIDEGLAGSFDLAFIDADKLGYDAYFEACLQLIRPGGVILLDNMLWSGQIVDASSDDPDTQALRALNEKLFADPRVEAFMFTVGDGIVALRVK